MQVRITRELISSITSLINDMKGSEITAAGLQAPRDAANAVEKAISTQRVIDYIWSKHSHNHLRNAIPENWKATASRVQVTLCDDEGDSVVSFGLESSISGLPAETPQYGFSVHIPVSAPEFSDVRLLIEDYIRVVKARRDISTRWTDTAQQVLSFLSSYSSLNKAVKEWDGLKRFLPSHIIAKLEARAPKVQQERPVKALADNPSIDLEKLEAAGVIGSLLINR